MCRGEEKAFAGYVAKKGDSLYFCWRGSVLKTDWEADANVCGRV
jgi:hypothetical protein